MKKIEIGMWVPINPKLGNRPAVATRKIVQITNKGKGQIMAFGNDVDYFKVKGLERAIEPNHLQAMIIGEPSHNIVDVLEVGDYVNYRCIIYKGCDADGLYVITTDKFVYYNKDIRNVSTKEQYEANCIRTANEHMVKCDCGHSEIEEHVKKTQSGTYCVSCYEELEYPENI